MRILFLDQFGEMAGGQRSLLDVVTGVLDRGWAASVLAPGDGPLEAALRARGVAVHPIRCGPYGAGHKSARDVFRFARDFPRLVRRVAEQPADLLYVNGPRVLPAAAWVARGRRPLVFHCHNYLAQRYAAGLVRTSLRLARADLIASSRFAAASLADAVPAWRRHVIYNGVEPGPVRERTFPPRGPWRIGVIGRIAPQKGQAEFLAAARRLVQQFPHCRFVLCGAPLFSPPAYQERVRALADGLPVEFLGWREDPGAVLAGLDLLVVPSVVPESTPRVILEAFSAGVPVVAFRSGGIPEILEHGRTGFLVDPPSPETLADALRGLMGGAPARLEAIAQAARAEWRERFTVDRHCERVLEAIAQALARSRAAEPGTTAPPLPRRRPLRPGSERNGRGSSSAVPTETGQRCGDQGL